MYSIMHVIKSSHSALARITLVHQLTEIPHHKRRNEYNKWEDNSKSHLVGLAVVCANAEASYSKDGKRNG